MNRFKYEELRPDCIYHAYNSANGSDKLFREPQNYEFFLRRYGAYISPIADTLAYCLMPNHFHLVAQPATQAALSSFMQWWMTSHVRRYHQHYKTDSTY